MEEFVGIKSIEDLCLYYDIDGGDLETVGCAPFPMVTLINRDYEIVAAIKFSKRRAAWHVDNVAAEDGYGPTIYKVLMQLAGDNGIAPCYKHKHSLKEFVVDKSKKIWFKFHKASDIIAESIDTNYTDDFLNYKFKLHSNCFDLPNSQKNLQSLVLSQYLESLSMFNKFLYKWFGTIDSEELKRYQDSFRSFLHREAKAFLEASVDVHS